MTTDYGWTDAEYQTLIDRLLADLARARGLTVAQMSLYYCLPGRPPMHRPPASCLTVLK